MYRFGGVIKIALYVIAGYFLRSHGLSFWESIGVLVVAFIPLEQVDALKRGMVVFFKPDTEAGPFDIAALPHKIRSFFDESGRQMAAKGFVYEGELMALSSTSAFGRNESWHLSRFYRSADGREAFYVSQQIIFMTSVQRWKPGLRSLRLLSLDQGRVRATGNSNPDPIPDPPSVSISRRPGLENIEDLIELHHASRSSEGETAPADLARHYGASIEDYWKHAFKLGFAVEDPEQGGYRLSWKGVATTLRATYGSAGRGRRRRDSSGLGPFAWQRKSSAPGQAPAMALEDHHASPESEAMVEFTIGWRELWREHFYALCSFPWVWAWILAILFLGFTPAYSAYRFQKSPIDVAGHLAAAYVEVAALALASMVAMFVYGRLPGARGMRLGQRRLKFTDKALCLESPQGISECSWASLPRVRKAGGGWWIRFPGGQSMAVARRNFSPGHAEIFESEIARRKMVSPLISPRIFAYSLLISLGVLAWGATDVHLEKHENSGCLQAVFNQEKILLLLPRNVTVNRYRRLDRWSVFGVLLFGKHLASEFHSVNFYDFVWLDCSPARSFSRNLPAWMLKLGSSGGKAIALAPERTGASTMVYEVNDHGLAPLADSAKAGYMGLNARNVEDLSVLDKGWESLQSRNWAEPRGKVEEKSIELPNDYSLKVSTIKEENREFIEYKATHNGDLMWQRKQLSYGRSEPIDDEEYASVAALAEKLPWQGGDEE